MRYFVIYLAAINLITFCVYGADKRRAKISGARRVPEKTLFALALLLGSAVLCCWQVSMLCLAMWSCPH